MTEKRIPVLFEKKELCCGCTACYATCPKRAVKMEYDAEGFLYPEIDEQKCIGCYMCKKVCPVNT